ncbi:hypothetical protein ACFVRB_41995 [Streptomyces nojiriensis]|uniref:hypothetical protein n=1 Tax=Streptomyces nojiriensis TaxID=66374 RepID=UPI0036DA3774
MGGVPDGFALDASLRPYVTTLRRCVRAAGLEEVCEAVRRTLAGTGTGALVCRAVALEHAG